MSNDPLPAPVATVTQALIAAGYAVEPDPANNTSNAPAYLKVFCRGIPKHQRVDYLNLVFSEPSCNRVTIEGEGTIYEIPADLKAAVERVRNNLPCSAPGADA